MFNAVSSVLVLAPHTDDGELGTGGTIARLVEQNINVYYAAFSTAAESVPEGLPQNVLKTEVKNATAKLGIEESNLIIYDYAVRKLNYVRQEILEELVVLRKNINPDIVFMPSLKDIHQDHTTVALEGLRAFKNKIILGYELIWNNVNFDTQCFITLEKHHVEKKISSLKEYKSQQHRDYMSEDFIRSMARARGVQVGTLYAEAFEIVRLVIS